MSSNGRLADRLADVKPSSTLAITAKAKKLLAEGKDIVNLSAGEPDFDTPEPIKEAAIEAIKQGFTKYTPTTGIPELKKAISEKFKKDNNLNYLPEQIIVSCGAKHSIFNCLLALVDPGDEVLIPKPYWVSYPEMLFVCGAKPIFIDTRPEDAFKIKPKELVRYISPKTKLFILNSPSNPTGCVYSEEELAVIAQVCKKNNIFVISDEIYEKLIYDKQRHFSIASFDSDIYNLTITVNGLSKSYSMTGWRIGYIGAPADIAEGISRLQDHSTSNPVSISQKAGLAALGMEGGFCRKVAGEFEERRDYCISRLSMMPKLKATKPQGAFYIFCDISKTGLGSLDFANRLLEEALVSIIPGEGFGRDDHIRISFACSMQQLAKGMDRIQGWLAKL